MPSRILKLRALCQEDTVPYATSDDIPRSKLLKPAQTRALEALELAITIDDIGYNVYLAGDPKLGRSQILNRFLAPHAKKKNPPPDLLYVYNFEDRDKPILLTLKAGTGKIFKEDYKQTLYDIYKGLASSFESDAYLKSRSDLYEKFNFAKADSLNKMNLIAKKNSFALEFEDKTSISLIPLIDGKKINDVDFEKLNAKLKEKYKITGDKLLQELSKHVRYATKAEQDCKDSEQDLEKKLMENVLETKLKPFVEKICKLQVKNFPNEKNIDIEIFEAYFKCVYDDMLENFTDFIPKDPANFLVEHDLFRYKVNLFVDNSQTIGAPIYHETNPSLHNLLGCIERETELGSLITDFTLIKAGTIHKALGGYLSIHITDLLQHQNAWEGLLRTLRAGVSRIHEAMEITEVTRTKLLEPQPIPLDIKIILIGTDTIYENLLLTDDRFGKFFKIKAHLNDSTPRNTPNIRRWLGSIAAIIDSNNFLPFTRKGLAYLVDFSSFICEDQNKLSLKFPVIRDVMLEANTLAKNQNKQIVDERILQESLEAYMKRRSFLSELYFEEYTKEMIKIKTAGTSIGSINVLSIIRYADHEFGLPHQISCSVGVGHDGIVSLEHEVEQSGSIHSKAIMIIKAFLTNNFARNKPLVFNASIYFEQNYTDIDGDSASGAELVALLSAISDVPIKNSLAFTGSVNQSGDILPISGVTQKIEGFYRLCKQRGLTGEQGVIIPFDNQTNLMLNQELEEAVNEGKFHIYPINHINEALVLFTDMPCGKLGKNNTFTPNSLFALVDKRFKELGWYAETSYKKKPSSIK